MIKTTTPSVEGRSIKAYLGIVGGNAIVDAGATPFKDMFAGVRDIYKRELGKAREIALDELEQRALALGADAVVAGRSRLPISRPGQRLAHGQRQRHGGESGLERNARRG